MSPSRRAKGRKRAPRERSRDRIAPPTPTRVGGRRSARERLIALAPLLILLALLLYLSTGPDRGAIRNVFGIFFLAWGLFLIVRAGLRLRPRPAQIQRPPAGTTAEAQTVDRVRAIVYLVGGVIFSVIGVLTLLGVIDLIG